MENAKSLPVAVAAALMPDAHRVYGLPIGGVLATDNAAIPYAVGMAIACRMKLTALDPPRFISKEHNRTGKISPVVPRPSSWPLHLACAPPLAHNRLRSEKKMEKYKIGD